MPAAIRIPAIIGLILGAIGGVAALNGRGSVDVFGMALTGLPAILAVAAILALVGAALGCVIYILQKALQRAADGN